MGAADSPVVAEDMSDAEAAWAVGLATPAYIQSIISYNMSISDRGVSHSYNPLYHTTY
jgi:hypothetical protein